MTLIAVIPAEVKNPPRLAAQPEALAGFSRSTMGVCRVLPHPTTNRDVLLATARKTAASEAINRKHSSARETREYRLALREVGRVPPAVMDHLKGLPAFTITLWPIVFLRMWLGRIVGESRRRLEAIVGCKLPCTNPPAGLRYQLDLAAVHLQSAPLIAYPLSRGPPEAVENRNVDGA